MHFTTKHHQLALTLLSGVGSRRARIIISHFNDLESFFEEKRVNLAKIPGIPADFVSIKHRLNALVEADKILERSEKMGVKTCFFTDKEYPRRLKQCEDAPLFLYYKGQIDWNPPKIISVVGTRHATTYGRDLTNELIDGMKAHQVTIVSGMAFGIDILAHQAALRNNLPTWGVLGHGLAKMYPHEHRKIAEKMLDQGGLISEFMPDQKPEPPFFPMRNRIVAGLSDATVVVESGEKGGSLITANLAVDYHRDVFAFPGDVSKPYSKGCLKLIQKNQAILITKAQDLIDFLSWKTDEKPIQAQRSLFTELNTQEEKIVLALQAKPDLSLDTISYLCSFTISEVSALLLNLEFKGLVRSLPGRKFQLIP